MFCLLVLKDEWGSECRHHHKPGNVPWGDEIRRHQRGSVHPTPRPGIVNHCLQFGLEMGLCRWCGAL